ncbi:hypothetical protein [Agromyces albus]|uniref:Uncharacterized protein n=1 Tax=Agromyces albus TaxID=205332 RepID=A0A4Q2KTC6_9MICO|nr:hypothetical protein [Agromyces albus]RXZ67780.1 hypothetical protein ESP51_16280 [Agromyces albus]
MLISELSFPHLQAEREARLTRELEQRRVVRERLAVSGPRGRVAPPKATLPGGRVAPPEATRIEATHKVISRRASAWAVFRRTPRRPSEATGKPSEHSRAV